MGPDVVAAELLASRYSLIVALVSEDGVPYATRGWGLTVLQDQPLRVRLLLGEDDAPELEAAGRDGRGIAVTAADPVTLHAVQMKGRAGVVEDATPADRATVTDYCDSFFGAVQEVDGTDREFLERLVPPDFVACTVAIDELYDQTPGPGAGAALRPTENPDPSGATRAGAGAALRPTENPDPSGATGAGAGAALRPTENPDPAGATGAGAGAALPGQNP
jgi:hypothetical protein